MDIGSVVQIPIPKLFLRCFSLLPATAATVPAIEATSATTGRPGQAATTPTASTLAVAARAWATTAVRLGTLSVVSRNNKSLREQDLEFKVRNQIP